MSDPILPFLSADIVALLLLGAFAAALPATVRGLLTTTASGLGLLLCLPSLLTDTQPTTLALPVGPPALSLDLALDPLAAFFLIIVFLAGTAIAAFQATTTPTAAAAPIRMTAFCLAGAALSILAADGVTLAIGLAFALGALRPARGSHLALLIPLLMLAAVCLMTQVGLAPRFAAIRSATVDPGHATAAAVLVIAAVAGLISIRSNERDWTRDALTAGMLIPSATYLLPRLLGDLPGSATPSWCGFVLLLAGDVIAVVTAWTAAMHPDIDGSAACLVRRQAGLAMAAIGLGLIARTADLPGAASFAFAAAFLSAIGASLAGVLTALAVQTIASSAGTHRLSRLGGLIHAMPNASAALAAGLFGLSAIPSSLGFASLWLLFRSILAAPRIGGLVFQLPLALTAAAVALSAAAATAGSVRLLGIAILGRPRTPRGAGAYDGKSPARTILLMLSALSVLIGIVPGTALWLLADPAIRTLTGIRLGLAWASPSTTASSYMALPLLALVALATGTALLATRWSHKEAKIAGPWTDGMASSPGLPFGEPAAQSAGEGFLPVLPPIALPRPRWLVGVPAFRAPSAAAGRWIILAGFGALLVVLAMVG